MGGSRAGGPRITPGTAREIGRINAGIARAIGLATRSGPPNVFTTLARHRRLFRRWLRFAGALMPGGRLARKDTELVILRVAHSCGCGYEWHHHERLGRRAGLSAQEIARVREGAAAPGWTPRQALLLRATDELLADHDLSDEAWDGLRPLLSDEELIELCMLAGHYAMLAGTLNALQVEADT